MISKRASLGMLVRVAWAGINAMEFIFVDEEEKVLRSIVLRGDNNNRILRRKILFVHTMSS